MSLKDQLAPVVEDDPVLAKDLHAHAAETVHDAEGFPSGPCDPSVLTDYGDHVVIIERPELKLSSHGKKVQKFGRLAPEIEGLVAATGLSPLITCSVDTGDRGLISAFMERWHKETSSFHLPVGELTITLDDVVSLLHLPILGAFHSFEPLHIDEVVLMLGELLEVFGEEVRAEIVQCHGAYGAAALVHMYDHLNDAYKSGERQLAGYITLLQCWIYEHFSYVAECLIDPEYDEISPRACRWIATKVTSKSLPTSTYWKHLDGLTIPDVCWMPYERVVRQFGYVQTIPPQTMASMSSFEDTDDRWMHYSDYLAAAGQICLVPEQCASDYMEWFFMISHLFMTPAQAADLP
ncbi:Protein MAIN-LIKE 1 [Glycine max]|nr:Protein MAIN-LIKE 1 [Glycine max]